MHGADGRWLGWLLVCVGLLGLGAAGCGSRSEAISVLGDGGTDPNRAERCNGLDDDGKGGIDDPFRDSRGRYVMDTHCGACNQACVANPERELETHCRLVDELPRCVAERCAPGYAPARDGHCAEIAERLCLPCTVDADCGSLSGARCLSIGGETRCSVACELGCPQGYVCDARRDACVPSGGSCSCEKGERYDYACAPDDAPRDAGTPVCVGRARCEDGVVTSCRVAEETCDELDNDCDGLVDEGFRDPGGAYSLDPAHCGQCGASCLEDTGIDQKLVCGGDPFAPRCSLACPDALDGIMVGDKLDGDLSIATGCECVVQKLNDEPGPVGAEGQLLDENCDGADGMVRESFYVAGDGDDSWPGSPTRPLRTIGAAISRASASLKSANRRPHVFVASGAYTESITLLDGVQVHGGYRRDFRALDPAAYTVEVRAPRPAMMPGGPALVAVDVGTQPTRIEGLSLRGLDAAGNGAALGAYLERPGPNLVLTGLIVQAGVPGDGVSGSDGEAGAAPSSAAGTGSPPRAARETPDHFCIADANNTVRGGSGGTGRCGGIDVSGGSGGSASCPAGQGAQPPGASGRGPSAGAGGQGGQDAVGPLQDPMCPGGICCGLADFTVPTNFEGPRPGLNGGEGQPGTAGTGCSQTFGRFDGPFWSGGSGSDGSDGQAGSGGGGGGSGGGGVLNWVTGLCEFADGLGGGGGGGGAGGCGGRGGKAGSSGAPSVALLVIDDRGFTLANNLLISARGGRGGNGGAGGDGGAGGTGASGGTLPLAERNTPTLAAPFPGARGGSGGSGGAGGGGGGGCGGASVGIVVTGSSSANAMVWSSLNRFQIEGGGEGGAGGGGARAGGQGMTGGNASVRVQP